MRRAPLAPVEPQGTLLRCRRPKRRSPPPATDEGSLNYDQISPVKPYLGGDFRALGGRMQAAVQTRYGVHPWDEQISACTCSGLKVSENTSAVRKLSCYGEA
jgi:hypothetical protein